MGFAVASAAGAAEALRDVAVQLRRSAERVQQGPDGAMARVAGGAGSRPWWATWWGGAAVTAAGPAGPGLVAASSADFRRGFRDELAGVAALVVDLVPLASAHEDGAPGAWGDLRDGLWWGARNPIEFAKAAAGLPELREQGPEYWAGMITPGLIAAVMSGGAGAAGRGAGATRRVAGAAEDVADAAEDASTAARRGGDAADDAARHSGRRPVSGRAPGPESLRGVSMDDVRRHIPEDWEELPSHHGGGTRWKHPTRKGEQVRVMPGKAGDPDPLKQGPYAVISKDGARTYVLLEGNHTLR